MKKKALIELEREERETIARILLSTVLAFLVAWAIGRPYSPTIAVTANLCLYTDRGYRGGIRYGTRRVLVQAVQGILVLLVMGLVRHVLRLNIPDPVLIPLAACVALLAGLPVNYRHPYSPLVCTLGNATFIIACAAIRDLSAFPYRVLECLAGFVIGYGVNHVILPRRDRYQETVRMAVECTRCLLGQEEPEAFAMDCPERKKSETSVLNYPFRKKLLKANLAFLLEDNRKTVNAPNPGQKRVSDQKYNLAENPQISHREAVHTTKGISHEELEQISRFVHLLEDTEAYLATYRRFQKSLHPDHRAAIEEAFLQGSRWHLELAECLLEGRYTEKNMTEIPAIQAKSGDETVILGSLFLYLTDLKAYETDLIGK